MTNPFEEKRKNDRINRLVKENEALMKQLSEQTSELHNLRLQESVWSSIAETNKIIQQESKEAFRNGYNQAVWDVTQFLTDKQKEL